MAEADFINPGYYRFRIDGDLRVTDSASHFQSDNNRSAGQIIDLYAFEWQDTDRHGRPSEEAIIYEPHVGSFTAGKHF